MKQLLFITCILFLFSACKKEVTTPGNFCDCIVTGGEATVRNTTTDYYLYLDCAGRAASIKVYERDFKEARVYEKVKAGCAKE